MAGGKALNMLLTGQSGSGKSVYADQFLSAIIPAYDFVVILNTSEELREHAFTHVELGAEELKREYSAKKLAEQIKKVRRVHFEVPSGLDCQEFVSALGFALKELGEYKAERRRVLFIMDECQNFIPKRAMPQGVLWAETEGRKYGVDIIKITQTIASTSNHTIHMVSLAQVNKLVVFPLSNVVQRKRILAEYPECPDPGTLKFPDPERQLPGEYIVIDRLTGKAARITLTDPDTGAREVVWISGKDAQAA